MYKGMEPSDCQRCAQYIKIGNRFGNVLRYGIGFFGTVRHFRHCETLGKN